MPTQAGIRAILFYGTPERQHCQPLPIGGFPVGQPLDRLAAAVRIGLRVATGEERHVRLAWLGGSSWCEDLNERVPRTAEKHILIAVQEELLETRKLEEWSAAASLIAQQAGWQGYDTGTPGRNVFIIHGRDEKTLVRLAARIEESGYSPQILKQMPCLGGETIIEALERVLPEADCIVALFTPDDEGHLAHSDEPLKPRPRQNVLIESGYALIQRRAESVIIALAGVEIPSDLGGIRTIQAPEWGYKVEQELDDALRGLK